jgi:signal transduction histidine kinase
MIANLLDLSRVEAGAMSYHQAPCELGGVIQAVAAELAPLQGEHRVSVVVRVPPSPVDLEGDAEKLAQVVRNLLDNAIKFSPEGERVEVTLEVVPEAPSPGLVSDAPCWVLLRVADRGDGVEPGMRTTIFEKFRQAPGPPRRGGVGLGLAISREIVAAHHGRIWVEAREGGGSVFFVALPVAWAVASGQAGPGLEGVPS